MLHAIIGSKELSRIVSHTVKAADSDMSLIILQASGNRITVTAGGCETWSRSHAAAETLQDGRAIVGGQRLDTVLKALPSCELNLSVTDDGWLDLGSPAGSIRLRLVDDDYNPQQPTLPDATHPVDPAEWKRLIQTVAHLAGRNQTVPILTGIHLECRNETLTASATDRTSAARCSIPMPGMPDGEWTVSAQWLTANMNGVKLIGVTDRILYVSTDADEDAQTLMAGSYPTLTRILASPAERDDWIDMDRTTLLDAIRLLKSVNFTTRQVIPLKIEQASDGFRFSLIDSDSNGTQLVPADTNGTFDESCIAADPLIGAIAALDSDHVRIYPGQAKPLRPFLISPVRLERDGHAAEMKRVPDETALQAIAPMIH